MAGKSRGKLKGSTSVYRAGNENFGNNEQSESDKSVWDEDDLEFEDFEYDQAYSW